MPTTTGSARNRARVRMVRATGGGSHDEPCHLEPLLRLMDLASCASAEKHTGVNCVTASMGDVVLEAYPQPGDWLEVVALPVDTGTTSLSIGVTVVAHGVRRQGRDTDGDDDDDDDEDDYTTPTRICEAFFTYVTTRGPDGEKRYVPPLEDPPETTTTSGSNRRRSLVREAQSWERTLARFRKQLIRSEQSQTPRPAGYAIPRSGCVLETSEVVLPSHQNHMEHLFGGVVMGWMSQSALVACSVATRRPLAWFRIRSVQRVDFPRGADVSDHVFLRPRITAVFRGGTVAEVEVMVGKRLVTGDTPRNGGKSAAVPPRDPGAETTMNFGYFYVTGALDPDSDDALPQGASASARVAPFAKLGRAQALRSRTSTDYALAEQRLSSMLARRHLLAGLGAPVTWHPSLTVQAPLLTILSFLRLCETTRDTDHEEPEHQEAHVYASSSSLGYFSDGEEDDDEDEDEKDLSEQPSTWKTVSLPSREGGDQTCPSHVCIEWMPSGQGHHNTVVLRGTTVISRRKCTARSTKQQQPPSSFLQDVYRTLKDRRPSWDPSCVAVRTLERKESTPDANQDDGPTDWDVSEYQAQASPTLQTRFCLLRAGTYLRADGSLFRESGSDDEAVDAIPKRAVLASRSVRHEQSESMNRLLPSGWLLEALDEEKDGESGIEEDRLEIIYIAEHDVDVLRKTVAFEGDSVSDEYIVNILASLLRIWFVNLASFDHYPDNAES